MFWNVSQMMEAGEYRVSIFCDGQMIGSVMIMEFPTREAFEEYLEHEPYMTGGVWKEIKIDLYNTVVLDNEKVGK